jgi:ketosteroid isomerase-like protein
MSTDARSVVENLYAAWTARDLPRVLALCSDDMTFALHIPADVLPIGGETTGKAAVAAALQGLFDTYDFLAYEPGSISSEGATTTAVVHFRYRHKATGEIIDGQLRHAWLIEGGNVVRLDEWHDLNKVKAFLGRVAVLSAARPS